MTTLAGVKLGVQLWSLNGYEPDDFGKVLQTVSEIGYDGVEFAGFHGMPAEELKRRLADENLAVAGSHTGLNLLREQFEATVDYNLAIGNRRLIVPGVGEDVRGSLDGWRRFADELCGYQERVRSLGLLVGYHNHDFEFRPLEGKIPYYEFLRWLPSQMQMQLDMGWCFLAGHDARDIFRAFPGRFGSVHVKAFCKALESARLGEDDVDWARVLPVAVEAGKAEWFVVEHENHGGNPPVDNVKVCLDYLRALQR